MKWGDPSLSEVFLGGYLTMLTLLWTGLVAGVGSWQRRFALPAEARVPVPRLSVCVPARNEAENIGPCVQAVLASDHPDLEMIIVDDGSTDGTADRARAAASGDPRLRILVGTEPPPGWAGKPWACHRAAGEADGTHLLFIDADVRIAPQAARRAAEVMVARRLDLVSLFGSWQLESFWERVVIPVVGWFIRGATDVAAVNAPGRPEAFANGQFILVDRAAYDAVGGHGVVRGEVLDDVRLARAFKQRGHPIGLYFAPALFRVRLYRSLGEIVAGYTKNLYEGMDRRPHIAVAAWFSLIVAVLVPWLFLGLSIAFPAVLLTGMTEPRRWIAWLLVVCFLPLLLRWRLERAEGRSGWLLWSHPLGNAVLAWILLRAVFQVRTTWKGRSFHDGKAVPNEGS